MIKFHGVHTKKEVPVAIIAQKQIFGWKEIEILGDLERLNLVLNNLPDEDLMQELEKRRGNGRDDFPVRVMWNSIIAGILYQHNGIESLIRELLRNGQLREVCGFDVFKGAEAIPKSWNYSRFLKNLLDTRDEIDKMFNRLVATIAELVPDFGKEQAIDGKAISSHANGKKGVQTSSPDGRRDTDANWGKKVYKGTKSDGTTWEKIVSWFGYRLHLVVDAIYELPIAYEVTKASTSEMKVAKDLLEKEAENQGELLKRCEYHMGDRGYDDSSYIKTLWDDYKIKPVIDIRNMWKDSDDTKQVRGVENVIYNYKGDVSCVCMQSGKEYKMAYGGFEKDRMTHKYRCPAKQYGIECEWQEKCKVKSGIRISLDEDRRIFTPLARSSYKWKTEYKKRTAVERVNSRIDNVYCFEKHFIRGLKKMKLKVGLSLCVMLALALGRIKENRQELMRSMLKSA
jgi:hypothetical protein